MPHLKVDSHHPQPFFDVLNQMNITEGTEIEVERIPEGILIKPVPSKADALKAALLHPFMSAEVQKAGFAQAAREIRELGIPENSPDVDSDWWIQAIANTTVHQPSEISFDDE